MTRPGARIRQLEAIADLGLRVIANTDLEPVFDLVIERATGVLEVELGKVLELLDDRSGVKLVSGIGWTKGLVGTAIVPIGRESQAGYTLDSTDPIVVGDLRTESRFSGPQILLDHDVRSGISVAIPGSDGPWGVLGIHSREPATFTHDDVAFVQALANLLGAKVREVAARRAQQRAEAQLAHAQRMEAIGTLAGGIAHDFNNLLTVIDSCTVLAIKGLPSDSPAIRDLTEIRNASGRAAQLTSQILAFGRKQVLRPRTLDLNVVVDSTLRLLRRTLGEQCELDFLPGEEIGRTFADPVQIEQVLLNLCVNARDAMPRGGRIVVETQNMLVDQDYVSAHAWAKPGRYVLLTVSDTGTGIAADVLPRVFDPFFTTKEVGRGTGLGLAAVHGIVHQHDGMIHVCSEPERGTTFEIFLPATEPGALVTERSPVASGPGGSERLLVAEDDELLRRVLERILESAGYAITLVDDGQDALDHFRRTPDAFDLVLLDAVMPRMDGRSALAKMRAIRPDLRFLLMSGYTEVAAIDGEEARAWVTKPYSPETLLGRIRTEIDGS